MAAVKIKSAVLEFPAAAPAEARKHFLAKLSVETDAWDVNEDMKYDAASFVLLDARNPASFAKEHIKGAVGLHHRLVTPESTARFDKARLIVVYCTDHGCNAAAKAAVKLTALGFQVKELLGGLEEWKKSGYPTESGA